MSAGMLRATGGRRLGGCVVGVPARQDLRTPALGHFQQFPFGVTSGSVGEGTGTALSPAHTQVSFCSWRRKAPERRSLFPPPPWFEAVTAPVWLVGLPSGSGVMSEFSVGRRRGPPGRPMGARSKRARGDPPCGSAVPLRYSVGREASWLFQELNCGHPCGPGWGGEGAGPWGSLEWLVQHTEGQMAAQGQPCALSGEAEPPACRDPSFH